MIEIWKPIDGYEERYSVSNNGTIANASGKILKQYTDRDGYKRISLSHGSRLNTVLVHRLVANAFIENPNGYKTVDHINGIKDDNRVENLQWMSHRQNLQKWHKEQNHKLSDKPKIKSNMKRGESRRIPIVQMSRSGEYIQNFISLMDAERATGIGSGRISLCINNKKPSAGGFLWKKATDVSEPIREIGG